MKVLYGFFSGIGDVVAIAPLAKKLSEKHKVVFAVNSKLDSLLKIMDVKNFDIIYFYDKSLINIFKNIFFIIKIYFLNFDLIIFSPHASHNNGSTKKIPFFLKLFKRKETIFLGNISDNNSYFFEKKIKSNLQLSIFERELDLLKCAKLFDDFKDISNHIFSLKLRKKSNKIVFNPFAGLDNRVLPFWHYKIIIPYLLKNCSRDIYFIGPSTRISLIENELSFIESNRLFFVSGSLENSIKILLDSNLVITMDSGFSHISAALGIKQLLINGASNFELIKPNSNKLFRFEEISISCQPCNKNHCKMKSNYCLSNISPFNLSIKILELSES